MGSNKQQMYGNFDNFLFIVKCLGLLSLSTLPENKPETQNRKDRLPTSIFQRVFAVRDHEIDLFIV